MGSRYPEVVDRIAVPGDPSPRFRQRDRVIGNDLDLALRQSPELQVVLDIIRVECRRGETDVEFHQEEGCHFGIRRLGANDLHVNLLDDMGFQGCWRHPVFAVSDFAQGGGIGMVDT